MLGISALLALVGLLIVLISVILMTVRKRRGLLIASFIAGLLLIFLPGTLIYLFLD